MTLVIDTSVLIKIEKGNQEIIEKVRKIREGDEASPCITFITYFEFLQGINKRNPKNKERALNLLNLFRLLAPTKLTASIMNDLKYKYERIGKSFSLSDLMIASQIIENNMTLVTNDKHFEEIGELKKIIL